MTAGERRDAFPPAERLQPVLDEIAAAPKPGQEADKAFDDDLSGDP
ncbi:hypothetical protein GCM10007886_11250 [Methylobacterium gregans]|nr:hypothetical protein GCM10007886_11250 [Methylobacterium gregans]